MSNAQKTHHDRRPDRLFNVDQIAGYLGITKKAVSDLIKFDKLPAINLAIGSKDHFRIWESDLVAWLEMKKVNIIEGQRAEKAGAK
ncbi:helix-turn-helix domain-containing protein [Mariniblastus sp.]|nr:helix-turn-helix domain-containing protein [Mariniblastus sp.]